MAIAAGISAGAGTISLPAPVEWAAPLGAPSAPGGSFGAVFSDPSGAVDPAAPVIAEWNRTTKPGESFTMTGVRFTSRVGTEIGTDTVVWVWADTPSGGVLRQARIWKVTDLLITATIPDDIPFGMFLIWVENQYGASAPICMNRTQPQWIGPLGNSVQAGQSKRVFGKNLSYGHGKSVSSVYIQPAAGGAFISCPPGTVEPFAVAFTIPVGTPNGNYKLYVHNNNGGQYAWSEPLDLVVADPWVRGTTEFPVSASGVDDTAAIQTAVNSATALPNGGTVRLATGTYVLKSNIGLKANVRIAGAGKDQTIIQARPATTLDQIIGCLGSHVSVEDLTLNVANTGLPPIAQMIRQPYPWVPLYADMSLRNIKMTMDTGLDLGGVGFFGPRCLVTGCDFYLPVEVRDDGWVHDNNLYGGAYGNPWGGPNEYPASGGPRLAFENNYVATPNWPIGPNGNRNYLQFLTYSDVWYQTWAKRMFGVEGSNDYIAHNTTKDAAVEDNKGEMILFHGGGGSWFGQCLSTSGLTTTVRIDGLVDDQAVSVPNYSSTPLTGGQAIPAVDGSRFIIISGAGLGQKRTIMSHTSSSVTVDKPWRVAPDSTSKAVIVGEYEDHIVYENDLNAFPVGYDFSNTDSASTSIAMDGDCNMCEAEGNVSHRTVNAATIKSNGLGVSFWNTVRDHQSYETGRSGVWIMPYEHNPAGHTILGNRFSGGSMQVTGSNPSFTASIWSEDAWSAVSQEDAGNLIENMTLSGGQMGLELRADALFRHNVVSVRYAATSPQPAYVYAVNANPTLVNNTYSGWSPTYYTTSGCTFAEKPVAPYKSARFAGYVGSPIQSQIFPIVDAGIASMAWTATPSSSWIIATIQSNPTLVAESEMGRLVIGIGDTSGMVPGTYWGSVTINTGSRSTKIGVRLDLASGSPAHQSPVASFTANPGGGAVPFVVSFDGSGSYALGGSGITTYNWDFGDGTYGTGVTVSHTYSVAGVYTPVLTVTDSTSATGSSWTNINASPALSSLTLSGNPAAPINTSTSVTLTASSTGGYQAQYKFLIQAGSGWTVLRDYANSNTCTWTPGTSGVYRLKVYAKSTGSPTDPDISSQELTYPVGLLPVSGLSLWLRADAGITQGGGRVSAWADQSSGGNSVSQSFSAYQPSLVSDSGNGKSAIRFGTGNNAMKSAGRAISGATAFTCLAVVKYNSQSLPTTDQYIFWNGNDTSNSGYGLYIDTTGYLTANWADYSGYLSDSGPINPGQWYVISARWSSNQHKLWINGVSAGTSSKSGSNFTAGAFAVGNRATSTNYNGDGFNGDIQEVVIYNRALSDTEKAGVESYLSQRYQPRTKQWIPQVKALLDGTPVTISDQKVATATSGMFDDLSYYVEEPDRFAGLKVIGRSGLPSVSVGDRLGLSGVVDTDSNGEKVLRISDITGQVSGTPLWSLGMANKALTGSGLLVRVWGKVTNVSGGYLTLDDGSGLPVKVATAGLVTPLSSIPSVGQYISATGPAGYMVGGVVCVRPRADSDIQVH